MKTSKIKIRPFISIIEELTEEQWTKDGRNINEKRNFKREPYATLKYGNVEIQIGYTVIRGLELSAGTYDYKRRTLFNSGIEQIAMEMQLDMDGVLRDWHRDGKMFRRAMFTDNPLHPLYNNHVYYENFKLTGEEHNNGENWIKGLKQNEQKKRLFE